VQFVQAKTNEGLALISRTSDRRTRLGNAYGRFFLSSHIELLLFENGGSSRTAIATGNDVTDFQATLSSDLTRGSTVDQSVKGCADHVVRVVRTGAFGHNVLNAHGFENRTHRTACDDTGTSRCGTKDNLACTEVALRIMVKGTAFTQRNADHVTFSSFGCLTDRFRNFTGFTRAVSDATALVTDNYHCGESKATAALNDFRDAVDTNQLVDEFVFFTGFRRLLLLILVTCDGRAP
jgi:hypothetical protein